MEQPNDDPTLDAMFDSVPDRIQEQVDNVERQARNARNQGGLPKIELIYHLLPGDDRRLGSMCTIKEVMNEFDQTRTTAGDAIRELASNGVLAKKPKRSFSFCIANDHWNMGAASERTASLRSDGGSQITTEPTTAYDGTSQQGSVGYHIDTASDAVELIDFSAGSPRVPALVGIVYCLVAIAPIGLSLPMAAALIPITVWALYECAKLPTRLPRETLRLLRTERFESLGV